MPEGVDRGRWSVVARDGVGIADIAVAEGDAEAADGHARDAGDDGKGEALLQSVGGGHELSLPVAQDK